MCKGDMNHHEPKTSKTHFTRPSWLNELTALTDPQSVRSGIKANCRVAGWHRHKIFYGRATSHDSCRMACTDISTPTTAADQWRVTLIGLLDLSAAFDCVDHSLLLQRLQRMFGLSGTVLRWLTSFVVGRSQQVAYSGRLSPIQPVLFRVPQGSVLGPLLCGRPQPSGGDWRITASSYISTPTTAKSTPVRQSTMYSDDWSILPLYWRRWSLVETWVQAGCDWTQLRRKSCG